MNTVQSREHNTINLQSYAANLSNKTALRLVWAALVAICVFPATSLGHSARLAIGLLVGLPSFALMIVSRIQLGTSFSVKPESRALVTTGVYSKVQHPMYLFLDLFLLGGIIALGWPILLAAWGIMVVAQVLQAQREEKVLAAGFGAEYEAYKRRTWF
jgi:protein-S-isoprenylcysteine O-methyltransferase Ste14